MDTLAFARLSRLTVGTVQLGMLYGRIVSTTPPNAETCRTMLDRAVGAGITAIDTAAAYGEAEAVVGDWLRRYAGPAPLIVSKLAALGDRNEASIPDAVREAVAASCKRLRRGRLDGYLVHRASDLFRDGVSETLRSLRDEGAIGAFGVSVYKPTELEAAIEVPGLSLVQLPMSVLDRRFAEVGLIDRCAERGITVFARSIYLQGVAFINAEAIPDHLAALRPAITRLRDLAEAAGCSVAALCLQTVLQEPGVASAVIGASRPQELNESLAAARVSLDDGVLAELHSLAKGIEPALVDPRRWP